MGLKHVVHIQPMPSGKMVLQETFQENKLHVSISYTVDADTIQSK